MLPWIPPGAAASSARSLTAQDLACRALDRLLQGGGEAQAAALLCGPGVAAASSRLLNRGAAILLDIHSGPIAATSLLLHRLGLEALIVRMSEQGTHLPGLEIASVQGDEQKRVLVLRRALEWLRAGRIVVIAADGGLGSPTEPVACCGRLVTFRRGAFTLARLSGAPVVPLFFRWRAGLGAIDVEIADAIQPTGEGTATEQESRMVRLVAACLEQRLLSRPSHLSMMLFEWFRKGRIGPAGSGAAPPRHG